MKGNPIYHFADISEIVLVKWGWPLFILGIICYWIPFKGLYVVTLISLIAGIWLLLLLSIRFVAHAIDCFGQKQIGKGIMFLDIALPGIALFIWSAIAQGNKWYVPASWENETITTALIYVTLLAIGVRWWYASGEALKLHGSANK